MRLFSPSRVLRAAQAPSSIAHDWSHTLHLPKSGFPARPLAAKLEDYRRGCADDLYEWQRLNRPQQIRNEAGQKVDNEFILHDGPPYANGAVHVGHALNKILKDLVLRTELSRGKRVQYRPGWDCHGLPIELKALQQRKSPAKAAKSLTDSPGDEGAVASVAQRDAETRERARELATRTIEEQKQAFKSWAVMGAWDNPYTTMQADFESRQLKVFKEMVKNGLIFRASRPVYWSPSSRTALAESELEYDPRHRCTAAYIKMPLVRNEALQALLGDKVSPDEAIYAMIWTTTPWTLPANKAIAINPDLIYRFVRLQSSGEALPGIYLLGPGATEGAAPASMFQDLQCESVGHGHAGSDLVQLLSGYRNVFNGDICPIVTADFVSAGSGTGLVHMAPGHGMEDYQVCMAKDIGPAFAPVDDAGRYTPDAAPQLRDQNLLNGLKVDTEGTKAVLSILGSPAEHLDGNCPHESLVFLTEEYEHKNPIDWRTKKPVLVRSTAQWFADVSMINDRALQSMEDVHFIPSTARNRLRSFIQSRSQWCISRQRAWGVPIPVIYNKSTEQENNSEQVIDHIISVIERRGTDAWFTDALDDPAWIAPHLDATQWTRKRDTMDVWFDSGTSWTSLQTREGHLADIYLEGSDQHRGWFQSSLLTKIACQDSSSAPQAPYKTLITHGFTLDGKGQKMSKSIGNVISPDEVIAGTMVEQRSGGKKSKGKQDAPGPDLLRLWVASCDYTKDVSISSTALNILQQALQKYRITIRFMLGVLQETQAVDLRMAELKIYDCIVLDRLAERSKAIFEAYKGYKFADGVRELNAFVSSDLSAFYFEIIKDTMYTGLQADRLRTQAVLTVVLRELLHWLSPLTPHLVQETWEHLPEQTRQSVTYPFHAIWEQPVALLSEVEIASSRSASASFDLISKAVKAAQEKARNDNKLGSGLACAVELHVSSSTLEKIGFDLEQLREALVVSELRVCNSVSSAEAVVSHAWSYEEVLDANDAGLRGSVKIVPPSKEKCPRCWQYTAETADQLCSRCHMAVAEQGVAV